MSLGTARLLTYCVVILNTCGTAFAQTQNGYVGVFGDAAGTMRCMQAPPGVPITLYVVAFTVGETASGISGAEFRIDVQNPTGYLLSYTPPQNSLPLGDPLGSTGLNIAWSTCQAPVDGKVQLGTIAVFNTGSAGPTDIIVKRRNPPSNTDYQCALFVQCDAPLFTQSCMTAPPDSSCLTQKASGGLPSPNSDEFKTSIMNSTGDESVPEISFTALATFIGRLPVGNPWSPVHQRLAFVGADGGLYTYDVDGPASPRLVSTLGSRHIAWSPDGEWLLCRYASPEDTRQGHARLIAVGVNDLESATLAEGADIGPFTWASNGTIYYWEPLSDRRRSLPPPAQWANSNPESAARPFLVALGRERLRLHLFTVDGSEEQAPVGGLLQDPRVRAVIPEDVFPTLDRHLVSIWDDERGVYTSVVDSNGDSVADLGDHSGLNGFSGTSVSPDGTCVIGHQVIDDGHQITSARIYVSDASGAWRIRVVSIGSGLDPRYARNGNVIAFQDPFEGAIHVGVLTVHH
jgi:hypothetical protein